jgi:pyruvate formate lyase activating enzyme
VDACKNGAVSFDKADLTIDRLRCRQCMSCAESCPTGAMEQKGAAYTCEDLVHELLKDRSFFEKSGGGVTISGGEPLLQPDFVRRIFRRLKEEGVHTALDTAGCVPFPVMEQVLEFSDLLLLDLKIYNAALHRQFTGVGNEIILKNARLSSEYAALHGINIWVRTPVIPGATDSEENIAAIGQFIAEEMGGRVKRWELCAFNNLCRDKYERLGLDWSYKNAGLMNRPDMEFLQRTAQNSMGAPERAVWTGAVNQDQDKEEGMGYAG